MKFAYITLIAALALPAAVCAQPAPVLLESYGRVASLLGYMAVHVGELLLACAEKNVVTEEQAEARYQAYRQRNAALLERAKSWSQAAERRLQAQGEERAAQSLERESSLTAGAAASMRAQEAIGKAADARAACAARLAAIESGHYDISANAELNRLLSIKP